MKQIPKVIIKDYLIFSIGLFLMIVTLEPFNTRDFIKTTPHAYLWFGLEAISFFVIFMLCEVVTTWRFHPPCDYSMPREYQIRRLLHIFIPCIVLNALFDGEFFSIVSNGWSGWRTIWFDEQGQFSLYCIMCDLMEALFVGSFLLAYMLFVTHLRMQKYVISELQEINSALETEQNYLKPQAEGASSKITISCYRNDTLIVDPQDILYIESMGNYLNVEYFDDSELRQKRLRSTLKDIEDILAPYPYIFRIHRAFMVNINYITQISGNAAGYKVELFSTDKILPVSKSNVSIFKDKIKNHSI